MTTAITPSDLDRDVDAAIEALQWIEKLGLSIVQTAGRLNLPEPDDYPVLVQTLEAFGQLVAHHAGIHADGLGDLLASVRLGRAESVQGKPAAEQPTTVAGSAIASQLLRELRTAHQIILNGLAVMTVEQKGQWALANAGAGVDGEGTTRFHERQAVLDRAAGLAAQLGAGGEA